MDQAPRRPRRVVGRVSRRWLVGSFVGVVLLAVVTATAVWAVNRQTLPGAAAAAAVTTSSSAPGSTPKSLNDSGSVHSPGSTWRSDAQTVGAWFQLTWPEPVDVHEVTLVHGDPTASVLAGFLTFSDGSSVQTRLDPKATPSVLAVQSRMVRWVRFTVSAAVPDAKHVAVAEVLIRTAAGATDVVRERAPNGNVAKLAMIESSAGSRGLDRLTDGTGSAVATSWLLDRPDRSWVQLSWSRPREIASIQILGALGSVARVGTARLDFDDGSTLAVGNVLADPQQPTTVSFMPRVVRSVRLTMTEMVGDGSLRLAEIRVFQVGSLPTRTSARGVQAPVSRRTPTCLGASSVKAVTVVVRCPVAGAVVSGRVTLTVVARSYSRVKAVGWPPQSEARPTPGATGKVAKDGTSQLMLDFSALPAGPVTVVVRAMTASRSAKPVYLQLINRSVRATTELASTQGPATGRTLVYDEEFDNQISVSRDGIGADYAAAKPSAYGADDFGSAIFPDPRDGFGNLRVIDGGYLAMQASPRPAGYADPLNWGREHIGAMLASSRWGGSGFSAQYGYFEARMFTPASPGTWPAFWMMPSANAAKELKTVVELDAVELYGHDPRYSCSTTHQYLDRRETYGKHDCSERFESVRAALGWHTYGVRVSPASITYYVDGRSVLTMPQVDGGGQSMFFMLDLALGGGWPIDLSATGGHAAMYVDYVRIYV